MYYYYQIIIKKSEHRCAICRAKERKKERKNERKEGLRASGNVELGAWCTRERSERTMENDRNRASGLFTRGNVVIIFALSCLWPRRLAQVHPPRNHSRKKRSPRFQPIRNRASPVYLEFIRTSSRTRALNSADTPGSSRCRSTRRRSAPFQFQTHAIFDFILLLLLNDENLSISYTTYCYNLREKEETIILLGFS